MSKFFPLMEFIGNICLVALLSFGGWLVMQNSLKPGELVAFFSLVNYLMWPIMNLGYVINLFHKRKHQESGCWKFLMPKRKSPTADMR